MSNELYHYGVLGMKWGVRRYRNKSRPNKRHKNKKKSFYKRKVSDHRRMQNARRRAKSMTDQQLAEANRRFQAEQLYIQNVQKDIDSGRSATEKFIRKSGQMYLNDVSKAASSAASKKTVEIILRKNNKPTLDSMINNALQTNNQSDIDKIINAANKVNNQNNKNKKSNKKKSAKTNKKQKGK